MKENPEVNYVPTLEGLKALYEYHGEAMELIFDSLINPSAPKKVDESEQKTDEPN